MSSSHDKSVKYLDMLKGRKGVIAILGWTQRWMTAFILIIKAATDLLLYETEFQPPCCIPIQVSLGQRSWWKDLVLFG